MIQAFKKTIIGLTVGNCLVVAMVGFDKIPNDATFIILSALWGITIAMWILHEDPLNKGLSKSEIKARKKSLRLEKKMIRQMPKGQLKGIN